MVTQKTGQPSIKKKLEKGKVTYSQGDKSFTGGATVTKTGRGQVLGSAASGGRIASDVARERTIERHNKSNAPMKAANEAEAKALKEGVAESKRQEEQAKIDELNKPRERTALGSALQNILNPLEVAGVTNMQPTTAADIGLGLISGAAGAAGAAGKTALGVGRPGIVKAAQAGRLGTITRTAYRGSKSVFTQRSFTGKEPLSHVNKIFKSSSAGRHAMNTKTNVLTENYLSRLGAVATSPATLVAAIGSYPFAGFIKEEALQTLSFATKAAIENGDVEGAMEAFRQQEEALDPSLWRNIAASIPYANVYSELGNFYDAAQNKLEQDRNTLALLTQQTGQNLFEARNEAQKQVQGGMNDE